MPSIYSQLRQVPDHQEVFLSPSTLTHIIFEVNSYVHQPDDNTATQFHFTDVIAPPDSLAMPLGDANRIIMPKDSLNEYPAYLLEGTILSQEVRRTPHGPPQLTGISTTTKVYQLLVRIEKHDTDLCVWINVPMKEINTDEGKANAETVAKEIMQRIISTLDVREFGLFRQ